MKRTMAPLVKLSDSVANLRIRSAELRVRSAQLQLKRERLRFIPNETSLLSIKEFTKRICKLSDQLRKNRRRINRLQMARQREIGILLGSDFSYVEIEKFTAELTSDLMRY